MEEKNIDKILDALTDFGMKNIPHKHFQEKGNVVRMGFPPTKIEILTSASGIKFDSCYKRRKTIKIQGILMNFISKADLMKNKKASGRLKDLADLEALE